MAYNIETRIWAVGVARECGNIREAERRTGIPNQTLGEWVRRAARGEGLAGVYTGHFSAIKEADVTGVDERLPQGGKPAYSGFDGDRDEKIRQLELENDILRGLVEVLKGASLGQLTNREKTVLIDWLRQTTGRPLRELTASLRISKSSYEYQRAAIARGDKYAAVRAKVVELF